MTLFDPAEDWNYTFHHEWAQNYRKWHKDTIFHPKFGISAPWTWHFKKTLLYKSLFAQFTGRNIFQDYLHGGLGKGQTPFDHYYRPLWQYAEQTGTCLAQDKHATQLVRSFVTKYSLDQPLFGFLALEKVSVDRFLQSAQVISLKNTKNPIFVCFQPWKTKFVLVLIYFGPSRII